MLKVVIAVAAGYLFTDTIIDHTTDAVDYVHARVDRRRIEKSKYHENIERAKDFELWKQQEIDKKWEKELAEHYKQIKLTAVLKEIEWEMTAGYEVQERF